jgi:hypothetical protein
MQTLRLYLYDQILSLQISPDQTLILEDRTVFTKPIVIYKGINNRLKILVKNADQKAVNITGLTFYAELVRTPQRDFVSSFNITNVTPANGVAELEIPASVINPVPVGYYHLLVKYNNGTDDVMAYADDNYSVAIPVELKLGYRVSGDEYDLGENLDMGSVPELVDEIRDLGAL